MKKIPSILLVAALAIVSTARSADIVGVVTFQGTPPAEKEITPILDNPDCAAMYNGKAPTTHFR